MILLNFGWMVDLAMSSFEFLTKFLVFWHPWHPWVCIRSVCWKWDLKQIETIPPSVYCFYVISYFYPIPTTVGEKAGAIISHEEPIMSMGPFRTFNFQQSNPITVLKYTAVYYIILLFLHHFIFLPHSDYCARKGRRHHLTWRTNVVMQSQEKEIQDNAIYGGGQLQ